MNLEFAELAGIPGQPAPASLKRVSRIANMRHIRAHSGAACPGLIEAIQMRSDRIRYRVAFRGSLPRPH